MRDCRTSFVNRVTLSSERAGVIASVPREGDGIEKGKVVIRLSDQVPQANLKVAQARAKDGTQIQVAEKSALAAAAEASCEDSYLSVLPFSLLLGRIDSWGIRKSESIRCFRRGIY